LIIIIIIIIIIKKKVARFQGLTHLKWDDLGTQEVIEQGSFGAKYSENASESVEVVVRVSVRIMFICLLAPFGSHPAPLWLNLAPLGRTSLPLVELDHLGSYPAPIRLHLALLWLNLAPLG